MPFSRLFNVVGAHAEGEVGDVVTGGFLDIPAKTMHEKMLAFWTKHDQIRQLLLNEPRGREAKCANLIVVPWDPTADAGFLIMESEEYAPMSGSNAICVTTVLLETEMVPMREPSTTVRLDTAAGLVVATAECKDGKCVAVELENVPSFVLALDLEVDVPGFGPVLVDIAYGGMMLLMRAPWASDLTILAGMERRLSSWASGSSRLCERPLRLCIRRIQPSAE